MQHSHSFIDLISNLKQTVKELNCIQVKELIDTNREFALIDVRETEEWDNGYIPSALHLSKGVIERDIERVILDKNTEIVLYCRGGMRSLIAADSLTKMGYTKVASMEGGYNSWLEAGYPVTDD